MTFAIPMENWIFGNVILDFRKTFVAILYGFPITYVPLQYCENVRNFEQMERNDNLHLELPTLSNFA